MVLAVAGLQFDRPPEVLAGAPEAIIREPCDEQHRAQDELPGRSSGIRTGGAAFRLDQQHDRIDLSRGFARDFLLDRQQIVRGPVEPSRPDHLIIGPQIEQPQRDAQLVAAALDRAVQKEIDAAPAPYRGPIVAFPRATGPVKTVISGLNANGSRVPGR